MPVESTAARLEPAPTVATARDAVNVARLEQVFRDALSLDDDTPVASVTYGDTPSWDSLAHMQLVEEMEAAFDVVLSGDDIAAIDGFDAAHKVLAQHGVSFSS